MLPALTLVAPLPGVPPTNSDCRGSVRVFGNLEGKTWTYQSGGNERSSQTRSKAIELPRLRTLHLIASFEFRTLRWRIYRFFATKPVSPETCTHR